MIENGSGAVNGNAQNVPEAHTPRTYSSFPLKAHRFNTERYGEYTPIIALEGVKNDKLNFNLSHNVMSYTLKSPLMQNVSKVNDLFMVPMEAILPLNWEKFFDNPLRGDDVASDVGPCIEGFWTNVATAMSTLFSKGTSLIQASGTSVSDATTIAFRLLVILEAFYSNGSLMSLLGCHGSPYVTSKDPNNYDVSFDRYFDNAMSFMETNILNCEFHAGDGTTYYYDRDVTEYFGRGNYVPFRYMLSLMRDDLTGYFSSLTAHQSANYNSRLYAALDDEWELFFTGPDVPFNTQFISSYQLCCAHYFSNDSIDFVYSAELYRQLIYNLYLTLSPTNTEFVRNGISYRYDALSAHVLNTFFSFTATVAGNILTVKNGTSSSDDVARAYLGYFSNYWCFRRSLRYQDYFSGARIAPLAVGNTSISVSGGSVSVLDVTRNIQMQRFLNSVNRIGHKFESYLKGIFGGSMPAPDFHNPFYLANHSYSVYGDETPNTGDAQINPSGSSSPIAITTNLRGNGSKYMYEITPDRPCVIIAISHYDVARVHMFNMDRSFLHVDRFDYFNPFLQYVGDQTIYLQELGIQDANQLALRPFAYALRHMEYKQLYNSASGGFVENLPGWCFPSNDRRGNLLNLSPDWIRAVPCEFDNFYVSLTGFSLASYFHFIVDNTIDCSGSRPMAYSPQILG